MKLLLIFVLLAAQSDADITLRVVRLDKTNVWVQPLWTPVYELRQTYGVPLTPADRMLGCKWARRLNEHHEHVDALIEVTCGERTFALQGIDMAGVR